MGLSHPQVKIILPLVLAGAARWAAPRWSSSCTPQRHLPFSDFSPNFFRVFGTQLSFCSELLRAEAADQTLILINSL